MFCCNDSKLDATSCNTRPVEVAKVPVKTERSQGISGISFDRSKGCRKTAETNKQL